MNSTKENTKGKRTKKNEIKSFVVNKLMPATFGMIALAAGIGGGIVAIKRMDALRSVPTLLPSITNFDPSADPNFHRGVITDTDGKLWDGFWFDPGDSTERIFFTQLEEQ